MELNGVKAILKQKEVESALPSELSDNFLTVLILDYQRIILDGLKPEMKLLDVDTGGGEFLLSLHHSYENTSAAEAYPPNVELCKIIVC